jgi:hypothetical protein
MQRLVKEAGQSEIANLDFSCAGDHYVSRLEVAMHNPVPVQVDEALQQLVQDGLDGAGGYGLALGLIVVVDDLEQVVLGILEYDEDALFFQDYLDRVHDVWVRKLGAQGHLSYRGLRYARILQFTLLIRLESAIGSARETEGSGKGKNELLDGKLASAAIAALGLVDASIGSATNEAYYLVALVDPLFGVVAGEHGLGGIRRVWPQKDQKIR